MRTKSDGSQKSPITFRLSSENMEGLKELAALEDRTISNLIQQAIYEFLEQCGDGKPLPTRTPTTALKKMRQSQRLAELEQTAKNLLAAIQAMRDEDAV